MSAWTRRRFVHVDSFVSGSDYVEFAAGKWKGRACRDGNPCGPYTCTRAEAEHLVAQGLWRELVTPEDLAPAAPAITQPEPAEQQSAPAAQQSAPISMILHCPKCGLQHVDEPDERTPGWENPPHRSHLCHGCGHIWRPADVAMGSASGAAKLNWRGCSAYHKRYAFRGQMKPSSSRGLKRRSIHTMKP